MTGKVDSKTLQVLKKNYLQQPRQCIAVLGNITNDFNICCNKSFALYNSSIPHKCTWFAKIILHRVEKS